MQTGMEAFDNLFNKCILMYKCSICVQPQLLWFLVVYLFWGEGEAYGKRKSVQVYYKIFLVR